MKSIKPNKPKAMIVFYKILFPVREKRSAAVSLFPFRQISEFPTGAALLKAAELSRHCRLVYVTYRKVSVNVLFAGSWVVPRYRYDRPFARFVRRDFFMSCRKRPRETPECAKAHSRAERGRLRHISSSRECASRGAFLCHRAKFPMTQKKSTTNQKLSHF